MSSLSTSNDSVKTVARIYKKVIKAIKLEQRNSNYVQLINELKSRFKMGGFKSRFTMVFGKISEILTLLLINQLYM